MEGLVLELLKDNKNVIIPDLGSFIKSEGATSHTIIFNQYLKFNDKLLQNKVAESKSIEAPAALELIKAFAQMVQSNIKKGTHEFPGLGTLSMVDDKLVFKYAPDGAVVPVVATPKEESKPEPKAKEEPIVEEAEEPVVTEVQEPIIEEVKEEPAVEEPEPIEEEEEPTILDTVKEHEEEIGEVEEPVVEEEEAKEEPEVEEPELDAVELGEIEQLLQPPVEEEKEAENPVVEEVIVDAVPSVFDEPEVQKEKELKEEQPEVKEEPTPKAKKEKKPKKEKKKRVPKQKKERKPREKGKKKKGYLWIGLILILGGGGTVAYLKKDLIYEQLGWNQIADASDQTEEVVADPVHEVADPIIDVVDDPIVEDTLIDEIVEEPIIEEPVVDTPVVSSGKLYHIVGGSFGEQSNATNFVNLLKKKGYPAVNIGKRGKLYTVSYGGYPTKKEAKSKLEEIKDDENSSAWILHH